MKILLLLSAATFFSSVQGAERHDLPPAYPTPLNKRNFSERFSGELIAMAATVLDLEQEEDLHANMRERYKDTVVIKLRNLNVEVFRLRLVNEIFVEPIELEQRLEQQRVSYEKKIKDQAEEIARLLNSNANSVDQAYRLMTDNDQKHNMIEQQERMISIRNDQVMNLQNEQIRKDEEIRSLRNDKEQLEQALTFGFFAGAALGACIAGGIIYVYTIKSSNAYSVSE